MLGVYLVWPLYLAARKGADNVNGGRLVGSWALRSGNTVDAYLVGGLDGPGALRCEWDRYPLTPDEAAEWTARVRPALVVKLGELLERPGASVVIPL